MRLIEEPYLTAVHGDAYRDYAGRVGRFLPGVGRIRTAVQISDGDLLVTTDNGDGNDVVLRVRPV